MYQIVIPYRSFWNTSISSLRDKWGAFYDDTPVIQAALTQVLKKINYDDMKEWVDRFKYCCDLGEVYFE